MTTQEVANQLVTLCRLGKNDEAIAQLYHNDIVSVEAEGNPRQVSGIDAVVKKGMQFMDTFEVHGSEISEPVVSSSHFAISYKIDVTQKQSSQRFIMDEIALYQVADGKIIREEFFYPTMG